MASTPSSDCATHNTPDVSDNELEDDSSVTAVPVTKPKATNNAKKATSVDCWSMKLDAFILNQHVFNQDHFIAPLNRPDNSAFLSGAFSAPDVIPFVDIDGAYPWYRNSRITDITKTPEKKNDYSGMLRTDRLGVYLHWCLPQHFRTGATKDTEDGKAGEVKNTHVPDRWIVFRCITEASEADPPALTPFIVESNRIRHFGGHIDPSVTEDFDVEVETSPFIDSKISVEKQVDVFMGMKRRFDDNWDDPDPEGTYHTPLTLLDSANPLFADFQHHNSNIFSIHDDVSWTSTDGKVVRPSSATISYAVFGYHSRHDEGKTICHGSIYNVEWTRDRAPKISEAVQVSKNVDQSQPIALGQDTLEALETYLHSLPENEYWVGLIDEMKTAVNQTGSRGLMDNQISQNLRAGFKPTDGGRCWRFNNDAVKPIDGAQNEEMDKPHVPTPKEMMDLLSLDRLQAYTDSLDRQERYLRHRLFCEWWKRRSRISGGRWSEPTCRHEGHVRLAKDLATLKEVRRLRGIYKQDAAPANSENMHLTARPEFFSRAAPSLILGGLGAAWPSEFLTKEDFKPRTLESLPFSGSQGATLVQKWLNELTSNTAGGSSTPICMTHGMKHFFQNADLEKRIPLDVRNKNKALMRLPALFQTLEGLRALSFNAPGWVRVTVDTLMEEWAYALSIGNPDKDLPLPRPAYHSLADTHWRSTQPFRALFLEWELEYYHLPKRFWTLQRSSDGTADYKISPGVNISSFDLMDFHKRTITGRSILRPNAEWAVTTLVEQLLGKLDRDAIFKRTNLAKMVDKAGILSNLKSALKSLNLVSGSLDGLTDHLLTLHQGLHVAPYESEIHPARTQQEKDLLSTLLESNDGQDVTPYGEEVYSLEMAERDFKPVTHGQAKFTKFNIVDKFGQVVSPIHKPGTSETTPLHPCLGRNISCQQNDSEGGEYANSVELDAEHCSQFFQLGHRINQDARLNAYFAVNSDDHETYHESTQYFRGDRNLKRGQLEHVWRPTTEYENPVWGWLMLDFRSMGIQVYNAAGESMGEALVPDNIHGKAYWQVYYAEGDLSESVEEDSQLQELIRRMSNTKFLIGLWSMLSDACQNIYHDPMTGDTQMLNLVGRPLALVNIGMNVELATPIMQTQSYQDLLKAEEITLESYKFEVLLGDKNNLRDGLVGYFPSTAPSSTKDPVVAKHPDSSCIYTDFGYPGRNIVEKEQQKPDSFASPSSSKVFLSPLHVNPADFPEDPAAYSRAMYNHPSTVVLGAIVDPYQPIHIATGILPSTTLRLPQWIIDKTLKNLRLLLRGGPVLTRGDLPDIETSLGSWQPPMNQTKAEACLPALTDKGEWSWLQPAVSTHAQMGHNDDSDKVVEYSQAGHEDTYLPKFVPYNLKASPSDYPLEMGPHTVLEGFYKYDLFEMSNKGKLLAGKPTEDTAQGAN